jgi:hypothetical protein
MEVSITGAIASSCWDRVWVSDFPAVSAPLSDRWTCVVGLEVIRQGKRFEDQYQRVWGIVPFELSKNVFELWIVTGKTIHNIRRQ